MHGIRSLLQAVPYYTLIMNTPAPLYERIYEVVRAIPPGRVSTYGVVGGLVGCPARVVGYALHYLATRG
jgi:alkylated DNA nucleotide flippase Atl1